MIKTVLIYFCGLLAMGLPVFAVDHFFGDATDVHWFAFGWGCAVFGSWMAERGERGNG